jgi:hypothetical protein
VIAARQKVQHFLTAACVGNLDLLKSKFFTFLFFPFPPRLALPFGGVGYYVLVFWLYGVYCFFFLMFNFDD